MSTVITISSLKGGVGKSSTTILLANCLGAAGKKVLVIDLDTNNSTSLYYLTDDTVEQAELKNSALALLMPSNKLTSYCLKTNHKNVSFIPSSKSLKDLSSIESKRLKSLLPSASEFDFIIIDTAPSWNNILLNAYYAADFILTPVLLCSLVFNAVKTQRDMMKAELPTIDNWFMFVNGYDHNHDNAKSGNQKEYVQWFYSEFDNLVPTETWFPWTLPIRRIIDKKFELTNSLRNGNTVLNEKLFNAVCALAETLLGDETMPALESF